MTAFSPSRRDWLKLSLGAGLSSPKLLPAAEYPKTRIAVKYQMIREELSVADKLRLALDCGLDGVEVNTRDAVENRAAFRKASEATGVPIHGVVNSSDPDIITAVELAADLGSTSVLVLAAEDEGLSWQENFAHWQKLVRKATPVAEKHEVQLLIENVRATFLKTAEGMAKFIDSFDSPLVGSYYDTGNTITWTEQTAQHWARVLGSRIGKLDIKDRGHAEFGDARLAREGVIGTDGGEVHWEKVRAELAAIQFQGWATAEVAGGDRKRIAGIAEWMNTVLRQ